MNDLAKFKVVPAVPEDLRKLRLCGGADDQKGALSPSTHAARQWVLNQAYALNHFSLRPRFWVEDQDGNVVYGVKPHKKAVNGLTFWVLFVGVLALVVFLVSVLINLWRS